MFTEADRVQIRKYLGYGLLNGFYSNVEAKISSVQSIADGGSAVDDSTELYVKQLITKLQAIDSKLEQYWCYMESIMTDGKIKVDVARAMQALKMEGRRLVKRLAVVLSLNNPETDAFSGGIPQYDPWC